MATRSRYNQQHTAVMGSHIYPLDRNEQDGSCEDVNPFYTNVDFAIPPEHPLAWPQLQPATWQPESGDMMSMGFLQSWETDRIINNDGPVMFGWQPGPIDAWDSQSRDPAAGFHNAQVLAPNPAQADGTFPGPLDKLEETFGASEKWQTMGWVEDVSLVVGEVVPSVESVPVEMESSLRAAKRRRKSHETTANLSEYASPVVGGLVQPLSIQPMVPAQGPVHQHRVSTTATQLPGGVTTADGTAVQRAHIPTEKRRRAPTPTIDFFEPDIPTDHTPTIPLTPKSESPFPFTPSVRVIDDGRDPAVKLRHGIDAVFKTQSANSKRGHYASEVWEQHKAAIKKLYIDESKPLREVIQTMERDHQFRATQRMYKARFKLWGFVKNNTEKVVSQILRTKFERDAAGKLSQFTRNGKDVNLQTYLQRKGMTEYDLVDFQAGPDAPAQVRCRTPPLDVPQDLRLPDRLRFQDTLVLSFKRSFLLWRQEEEDSAFGHQPSVFTWRVTDFPHLSSLIESARLIRSGDGASGVAALNRAFWAMEAYLASMDATASFYFFFHRQSRPWQEDARVALAVWKFLAAWAASRNHSNHPLFHAFKLMYEVIQKEGVAGLRELLTASSNTVADELERSFGRDHWMKDLIWHRCFPEKSKLRHLQLIRDLRDNGPTKKIVKRLY